MARWLWLRFVADGGKNYGALEEAHLCALLTSGRDLGYLLHFDVSSNPHPETVYHTGDFVDSQSELGGLFNLYGSSELNLDHTVPDTREVANRYVQRAIAFIAATPFTFLQEGR